MIITYNQCKQYFFNTHAVGDSKIKLIENDKMILDNESVSKKFNNYFSQIIDSFELYEFPSKPRREYTDALIILCQNSTLTIAL